MSKRACIVDLGGLEECFEVLKIGGTYLRQVEIVCNC